MVKKSKGLNPPGLERERDGSGAARPAGAPVDESLMTTRELMEFLNLSRTKVWELVTRQGLPAFKIGGDYRYRRSEVLAWLEKYRVRSGETADE